MNGIAYWNPNLLFDLLIMVLFTFYFFQAQKDNDKVFLFSGTLFGLFLEIGTIMQTNRYEYGKFMLMLMGVPISIGLAWGIIFYSSHSFVMKRMIVSGKYSIVQKSIIVGFLGLSIDLGMDAIAIRLGFWDWGNGFDYEYFGVPWGNFLAWFTILSSFSYFHQRV